MQARWRRWAATVAVVTGATTGLAPVTGPIGLASWPPSSLALMVNPALITPAAAGGTTPQPAAGKPGSSALPPAPAVKPGAAAPAGAAPAAGAAASTGAPSAAAPAAGVETAADPCIEMILAARRAPEPTLPPTGRGAADHANAYLAYDQGRYTTALSLAEAAAAKGDPQAHTLVARIHDEGFGVPKDSITAARWYARAAQLCDVPAMFTYGLMLAEGRGVEKDRAAAGAMLEKAALSGHALANYNLGLLFLRGDGKPENVHRAAQHIRYAAEKGVAAAQYDVAVMYLQGSGLPHDAVEASRWMNRAAIAGNTAAQYDYAVMLLKGLGLERDKHRVVDFMTAAAEKGVPGAQNRLAHMYKDGIAVEADPVAAVKWRSIAKPSVEDPVIDAALAKLSSADRAAGEKAASEWRERQAVAGPRS